MKEKIAIWGAGGHACVVADAITAGDRYEIAGFFVDLEYRHDIRPSLSTRVLGGAEKMAAVNASGTDVAIVAVGDCRRRLELAGRLEGCNFALGTVIHPRAVVSADSIIRHGTFIAAGAIVNPGVMIAENVIINTGAIVDHECQVAAGAHISPGAHLGGKVDIGRATWIGLGATVIHGVKIGANTVIGAGAVVVSDIPDNVIAYGTPAKAVRANEGPTVAIK